jgi:orotate phosphoribosyltransferase
MEKPDFVDEVLAKSAAMVDNDHFVYKALHNHGGAYIDKEKFSEVGAGNLVKMVYEVAGNALKEGLKFPGEEKLKYPEVLEIGILAPAYGALFLPLTLGVYFEERTHNLKFFPARSELKPDPTDANKLIHVIPEKRKSYYEGKSFIIFEDIINEGTTVREVKKLFENEVGANIFAAVCFVDRGGQTAKTLGVEQYYPLKRIDMTQFDVRSGNGCPLCKAGKPINMVLGKGKAWVAMFGQPPYPPGKDFSEFWANKK